MSIKFPESKVRVMPFGGKPQVLRYLFPLRYLWSVVSLREAVVVDRMWVGPVCVLCVHALNIYTYIYIEYKNLYIENRCTR